jgi:purine-binding chemotaxis protein CheW
VVEQEYVSGKKAIGLVVDSVSEVVSIKTSEIEKPPDFGVEEETGCIHGIAHVQEELIILLNVGRTVGKAGLHEADSAFGFEEMG